MKRLILIPLLLVLTLSVNALQIVENGNSKAVIIIPEKAPDSVAYAANELQAYIKKCSGVELQIKSSVPEKTDNVKIYVGYNDILKSKGLNLADLGNDGFKIISGNNWLALFGKDYNGSPMAGTVHPLRLAQSYSEKFKINRFGETGTLFAVYNFLEQFCGVRWYMPGELGEVVPAQKTLVIPEKINIKSTPDFEYRFLYDCDFNDDDESTLWYRRAGFGAPFPANLNHSFYTIFKKYQETNPEYFALIDGKRDFKITCQGHGNLCLSNPDVLKCFIKEARDFFDNNPKQRIFPVMPNDSFVNICECQECQKQIDKEKGNDGKFSNYVWKFVNDVAKEVYKTHPDRFIGCNAYSTYLTPPENIEKLNPNVKVMISEARANYWNPEYKNKINGLIKAWLEKIKPGNMYCWNYYDWNRMIPYLRNVPVNFPHIIAEDLTFLKGKSKGEFVQADSWIRGDKIRKDYFPGLTHINHYVTAKLMWNADTDVNKLLEEYYSKFYGPAAIDMKKFWEKAEELWTKNIPDRNNEFFRKLYTAQEVGTLMSYLRNARAKTSEDSLEQKRIDLIISEITPLESRVKNSKLTEKPSYVCQETTNAPEINANPDKQCWKDASSVEFVAKTGEHTPNSSKIMLCFDDKNLYLFFTNYTVGADTVGLKTLCKQKDSVTKPYIWDDDAIEIFLNPTPGIEKNYYQFIVNAAGVIWDAQYGNEKFIKNPVEWNSNIEKAIKINADSWMLEVKIPLADIGLAGKDLEKMTMTGNFIRDRPEGDIVNYSCWSPTLASSNRNSAQFGTLTFKKKIIKGEINDDDEKNLYSLENTDLPKVFIEAYEHFLKAKAGDEPAYTKAALEFRKAFEKSGKDTHTQLNSLTLEALCYFLSLDIDKALPVAKNALSIALKEYPDDPLIKMLNESNNKNLEGTEQKRISELAKLLSSIPLTEKNTFALSGKLTEKRKFYLSNIDLGKEWKYASLILSVLLNKTAPSFQLVEEKVNQAVCASNLRQLGVMLFFYAQEHEGKLPMPYNFTTKMTWMAEILKQQQVSWSKRGDAFHCPSLTAKGKDGFSYGMNIIFAGNDSEKILKSGKVLFLSDSVHYNIGKYSHTPEYSGGAYSVKAPYESAGGGTVDRHRHMEGANVLFSDGSVEWLPSKRISANSQDALWKN